MCMEPAVTLEHSTGMMNLVRDMRLHAMPDVKNIRIQAIAIRILGSDAGGEQVMFGLVWIRLPAMNVTDPDICFITSYGVLRVPDSGASAGTQSVPDVTIITRTGRILIIGGPATDMILFWHVLARISTVIQRENCVLLVGVTERLRH